MGKPRGSVKSVLGATSGNWDFLQSDMRPIGRGRGDEKCISEGPPASHKVDGEGKAGGRAARQEGP